MARNHRLDATHLLSFAPLVKVQLFSGTWWILSKWRCSWPACHNARTHEAVHRRSWPARSAISETRPNCHHLGEFLWLRVLNASLLDLPNGKERDSYALCEKSSGNPLTRSSTVILVKVVFPLSHLDVQSSVWVVSQSCEEILSSLLRLGCACLIWMWCRFTI